MWFIFDFIRSDLTFPVLCLCLCFFFLFFLLFSVEKHTQSDEKFPSSLAFFIFFCVRGEMAPHEWKWINWLLRFSAFLPHTYTSVYICIYHTYICIRGIYIVGFNLRRFTCKLMGRPNLRTCPIIGVLFESAVPATLSWIGLERHKKNVAKAKRKLWNKYTKRAIRDLWQAFMATQIFVKCLPKYLFI